MIKYIMFLVLFYFLSVNCFSQSGWVTYSTGTNRAIHDIYFVNANTGWAVGDSVIVKSTNGGVNWVQQNFYYPGGACLHAVKFINQYTGFVAGGNYKDDFYHFYQCFYKTTNGGINWILLSDMQNINNGYINNIFVINENLIFVTMYGNIEVSSVGGIYKSTNGGQNFIHSFSEGAHSSLFFITENTGWTTTVVSSDIGYSKGFIFKTTNGGNSWDLQLIDSGGNHSHSLNKIQFLDNNSGYAIGTTYMRTVFFKTTNAGLNWDTISYNHYRNLSLLFINPNTGWISGEYFPDSSSIAYTTNGGLNWQKQFINYYYSVSHLKFINDLTGWATLGYNTDLILRTTTGGTVYINYISSEIPDKYKLFQNYPNPFNPSTNIKYQIPNNGFVSIKVYDILGKEITTLVNEKQSPGTYEVIFDGGNLSSGIYFYKLETEGFSEVKKLILLK